MGILMELAKKVIEAFNNQDAVAVARNYTEDQVTIIPGPPEPVRGRQGKEEMLKVFFRAFPDLNLDISLMLETDNHVVCEGIMRGTHSGPLVSPEGEVPPTGSKIEIGIVFILRITLAGFVEEDRTYFDNAELLRQMGLKG